MKPEAEARDNVWIQQKAKELVFASGCTSWYVDERTGRNTMMYPDWQYMYWLRSVFVRNADFVYTKRKGGEKGREVRKSDVGVSVMRVGMLSTVVLAGLYLASQNGHSVGDVKRLRSTDAAGAVRGWVGALKESFKHAVN